MQERTSKGPRTTTHRIGSAFVSLALIALPQTSHATSITLVPVADTSLFAAFPNNNLGANTNLVSGSNGSGFPSRALIRFDVANHIPTNAIIQSVALTVNVVILPGGGGAASIFDLRKVQADWEEGVGIGNTGSQANDGEPTWNNRIHPDISWTLPGGAISNDFSETVSASILISGLGSDTFASTSNLVDDLQQWLLDPAANFGWVLMSESENTAFSARRFGSREDTNNVPSLFVEYLLPPVIQGIALAANQVQFNFLAAGGQAYTVQYRDSLASGDWQNLTNIGPRTTTTNLVVRDTFTGNARRFYRVNTHL